MIQDLNIFNEIKKIKPLNNEILEKARQRSNSLIMPHRALGKMHEIAEKICSIKRTLSPKVDKKCVFVMAGDHGVVEEGISAYPQEVTIEMIKAFIKGWATINVIAKQIDAMVIVSDVGSKGDVFEEPQDKNCKFIREKVRYGTNNFTKGPAMSKEEAEKSILIGYKIADKFIKEHNLEIVITGDMGIGNTTPSTAIASTITEISPEKITGKGTGIDSERLNKKIKVIKKGIDQNKPDPKDPIDVLSKVGGIEIGAIAGVVIAAAVNKIPVVVDGVISTAGAAIAYLLEPSTREYMLAGHLSEEPAHLHLLNFIGISPILNLSMRLGEGTGAAISIPIVETAVKVFKEVKTFEEAEISKEI